jgi:hypothetical protein
MEDFVKCLICGFEAKSLRYHIEREHSMSTAEYKKKYSSPIESVSIKEKRRKTNLKKHGVPHYTNRNAANFSFLQYEGGHPFKDPACRKKACETKKKLYGDPNYTNREKAKKTNLERYGTEYTCASEQVIEKRIETLKRRYGKVFNVEEPHNKTNPPGDFKEVFMRERLSYGAMSAKYQVSVPTIKRWVDDLCLTRRSVKGSERVYESPEEVVSGYLGTCYELSKPLSFYDYGKIKGEKYCNKLKRLFNKGKKFEQLKPLLNRAASDKSLKYKILHKMSTLV